jgi:hypothetical protein
MAPLSPETQLKGEKVYSSPGNRLRTVSRIFLASCTLFATAAISLGERPRDIFFPRETNGSNDGSGDDERRRVTMARNRGSRWDGRLEGSKEELGGKILADVAAGRTFHDLVGSEAHNGHTWR